MAGLYARCRVIVRPLDPNTDKATHGLHGEPCEYLLASVQPGGVPGGCDRRGDCARPVAKMGNCTTQNGERFPMCGVPSVRHPEASPTSRLDGNRNREAS